MCVSGVIRGLSCPFNISKQALARWLSWLEQHPQYTKISGSILARSTYKKQLVNE